MFTVERTPSGIKLTASQEVKDRIEELRAEGYADAYIITDLLDCDLPSGFERTNPEDVGALTDAPIISENGGENIYWFPEYQVTNELDEILNYGFVEFTEAQQY